MKRLSHHGSHHHDGRSCRSKCVPTLSLMMAILFVGLFPIEPCQSRPIMAAIDHHGSRDNPRLSSSSSKTNTTLLDDVAGTAAAAVASARAAAIETRMAGTINEVEWLLHQLVDIMTEMVNGIDADPTLLHNHNFRLILIQVIKRIDYVLEHFEMVGPTILTVSVQHELTRIDCIRIRLINYLSQSRRFDDSKCKKHSTQHATTTTTVKPPPSHDGHNDQILPILTQIVAILVRISDQLHVLEKEIHQAHHHQGGGTSVATTTVSPSTIAGGNSRITVDWDRLFAQMSQTTTQGPGGMSQTTSAIDWDRIFGQNSGSSQVSSINAAGSGGSGGSGAQQEPQKTTDLWPDLISQVSASISMTTTPSNSVTTTTTNNNNNGSNSNWEDIMNQLINQWNGNQAGF